MAMTVETIHPNAQRLRDSYRAVEGGDLQALLDILTDDVLFIDSSLGPLSGTYAGKQAVPRFFVKMMEVYGGTLRAEVVDVLANDERGIVLTRESGVADGEAISWTGVHVWSFRHGRCSRFVAYVSAEYQRFWADKLGFGAGSETPLLG